MVSETPDILPFVSPLKAEVLTPAELETVKGKTLQLLSEVGVHFPSPKALEIFAEHGAQVDRTNEIVRLPQDLVKEAMSTAPRSFILGGREERFDLLLDGRRSYLCTDGTGVHVIDMDTREKRPSRKEDIALMARVCDALPLVSFFWPMVSSKEYGRTAPLHNCHASLINTLKHVRGGTTVHPRLAPYIVEMASVVAGSTEERQKRPPICANICTISPLSHDKHGIETALIYAEAGIPTSFMAMPTMGSTAPATPLAALIMGDAEVISAMVRKSEDAVEQFKKGGREDLVDEENRQLDVLRSFLPQPLSVDEIQSLIDEAVQEAEAVDLRDLGKVMKALMPKISGRADGKPVNEMVRERLSG